VSLSADGIFGNNNGKLDLVTITGDLSTHRLTVLIDSITKTTAKSVSGNVGTKADELKFTHNIPSATEQQYSSNIRALLRCLWHPHP